jgi:hypothetical protein
MTRSGAIRKWKLPRLKEVQTLINGEVVVCIRKSALLGLITTQICLVF